MNTTTTIAITCPDLSTTDYDQSISAPSSLETEEDAALVVSHFVRSNSSTLWALEHTYGQKVCQHLMVALEEIVDLYRRCHFPLDMLREEMDRYLVEYGYQAEMAA